MEQTCHCHRVCTLRCRFRDLSQSLGLRVSTSEDKTWARHEEVEQLGPVRGDVHNSRISMAEHLDVVGALQLQSVYIGYAILMKTQRGKVATI